MDDRDQLRFERFERVQNFGQENQADWPTPSIVTTSLAHVDTAVDGLINAQIGQKRAPVSKQTLLDALRSAAKAIARTARRIGEKEPGFSGEYQMPEERSETALRTHIEALLQLLEDNNAPVAEGGDTPGQKATKAARRTQFIAYMLPADFVAHLRKDYDALLGKNRDKMADNAKGLESTADIEPLFQLGNDAVSELDTALRNLYARDPGKLSAWLAISRIEHSPKNKKPDGEGDSSTPPPPTKP